MNEDLRQIMPGQGKPRRDRWSRWAKSLSERYGRVASRLQGLTMLLLRPADPGARWIQAYWTLSPQIHLSLHPLLKRSAWANSAVTEKRSADSRPTAGARPATAYVPVLPVFAPDVHQEAGRLIREGTEEYSRFLTGPSWGQLQSGQLLQRLTAERKRIEQGRPHLPITLRTPESTILSTRADGQAKPWQGNRMSSSETFTAPETFEAPQGWHMGAPGMSRQKIAPEIDLERLTEQVVHKIDERIVAHRERMGRNF